MRRMRVPPPLWWNRGEIKRSKEKGRHWQYEEKDKTVRRNVGHERSAVVREARTSSRKDTCCSVATGF